MHHCQTNDKTDCVSTRVLCAQCTQDVGNMIYDDYALSSLNFIIAVADSRSRARDSVRGVRWNPLTRVEGHLHLIHTRAVILLNGPRHCVTSKSLRRRAVSRNNTNGIYMYTYNIYALRTGRVNCKNIWGPRARRIVRRLTIRCEMISCQLCFRYSIRPVCNVMLRVCVLTRTALWTMKRPTRSVGLSVLLVAWTHDWRTQWTRENRVFRCLPKCIEH